MSSKNNLIEAIALAGDITNTQADLVFSQYFHDKYIQVSAHDGYKIIHGAVLDRDVIRSCLEVISRK